MRYIKSEDVETEKGRTKGLFEMVFKNCFLVFKNLKIENLFGRLVS
jgi:hypothetical protein